MNIPKRFVAGTLYDAVEKEVVIGATCTLTAADGAKQMVATDNFGDFWFRGLPEAPFSLTIEAAGFAAKTFHGLNTARDVNLGDIALGPR